MGGLFLVAQPLVVAFAVRLRVLHDGQAVFNAQGIVKPPHRPGAPPKVAEFPLAVQRRGVPNDMIMDMRFINVGANDKGVIALGEAAGQFTADAVGLLRRNLPRKKRLAEVVGDHIVHAPRPAGECGILPLGKKKFGVGHAAVTFPAGDEPAVVGLLRVLHIVENVGDSRPHRPALAGVQGHEPCRRHTVHLSFKKPFLILITV